MIASPEQYKMIDGDIVTALFDATGTCISQRLIAEHICSVKIGMAGLLKMPCHRHKLSEWTRKSNDWLQLPALNRYLSLF
jgi:hypothetical protein